jgi:lipid-A-disaccharide synthase
LVASGTASLEAALSKRPMVVVYRLGAMTAWVLRRLKLVKAKYFAQPNLLADRRVVSEYFQEEIVPDSIGAELLMWLDDPTRRRELEEEFTRIHAILRRGGSRVRRSRFWRWSIRCALRARRASPGRSRHERARRRRR